MAEHLHAMGNQAKREGGLQSSQKISGLWMIGWQEMAKCDRETVDLMVLGRLVFPQNGGRKESREKETKIHTQMARDTKKNRQKLPRWRGNTQQPLKEEK